MVAIEAQIGEARTELRAAEQARDAMRKELEGEEPVFLPDAADSKSPINSVPEIDARIDALRRNLDELLRKYTDQHPDVVGSRRLIAELEKERDAQSEARGRQPQLSQATRRLESTMSTVIQSTSN